MMDDELDDGPVIEYFKNVAILAKDNQVIAVFFAVGDGSFVEELSHEATPEFLAQVDIVFDDDASVERCRELNRKGLELAGCISPETAYPFQKRYLPIINESYRRFNTIQEQSRPQPADMQSFGEKEGERGLRVSSEEFEGTLGDGFAVGIRQEHLERFCAAFEVIRLQPPSPAMGKMAEQLITELTAPELAGVNVLADRRLLVVGRTVDHSGPRPKVTGCDETRVLTILGALAFSQPAMLETYVKMMRASGIPVKAKPLTKSTVRFEVFEETLEIGLGKAN